MKKIKHKHGMLGFCKKFIKILNKPLYRSMTNNYKKMHGKPIVRRVALRKI
jgi:hypothetical protein